jgi:hypothetical protein
VYLAVGVELDERVALRPPAVRVDGYRVISLTLDVPILLVAPPQGLALVLVAPDGLGRALAPVGVGVGHKARHCIDGVVTQCHGVCSFWLSLG